MDMYQKRKIRQEKNMKKNEGQDVDNKTNINWDNPTKGQPHLNLYK